LDHVAQVRRHPECRRADRHPRLARLRAERRADAGSRAGHQIDLRARPRHLRDPRLRDRLAVPDRRARAPGDPRGHRAARARRGCRRPPHARGAAAPHRPRRGRADGLVSRLLLGPRAPTLPRDGTRRTRARRASCRAHVRPRVGGGGGARRAQRDESGRRPRSGRGPRHRPGRLRPGRRLLPSLAARGGAPPRGRRREYAGGGLPPAEARVLAEEMAKLRLRPPLTGFGLSMNGPHLLHEGSEELKRAHLPPIVRGEIRWCQGYSEPGAGSDLASLQTRAVRDGDDYILNGQKIWTSYGDKADSMFILVRTDSEGAKHGGITFLLMDMDTP